MKVWELMAELAKMGAGKEVEFSMLLSDPKKSGTEYYSSYRVDGIVEVGDTVMLFSEERSTACPKE